ncbi:hypothetical protein EBZ39_04450 [bacterium]|nr:hypothetical protein [bacterium]
MSGTKTAPQKPLKGEAIVSNFGSFDTISANSIVLQSVSIAGLFQDGVFQNVSIIDSSIDNTVIGLNVRNAAYFTTLSTNNDVNFYSFVPGGGSVNWNSETSVFTIDGELKVDGCSLLGNIEICGNDIKADNANGDIRIAPNGLGTLYLNGPLVNRTSNGSALTELSSGGSTFVVKDNFTVYSSTGSANVTTFDDQTYTTRNGDITLSTEATPTPYNITQILNTLGNTRVTTQLSHNLKSGDVVTIANSGVDNSYTVGTVLTSNQFFLSQPLVIPTTITRGNVTKTLSNNIVLDTRNRIIVPTNTKLTLGPDCNYITGNTVGLLLYSCTDIYLNANHTIVPQNSNLQFGSSGNNYIKYDGTGVLTAVNEKYQVTGPLTQINTTNTRLSDPILTVGDYTLAATDNKDRGLEFRYYDALSSSMKLGWFGWKASTGQFTYIPDATNTNEVISGAPGQFNIGDVSATNLSIASGGSLNLNCGSLFNVSQLTACNGTINVIASQRIGLLSNTEVVLNGGVPVRFGTSGVSIQSTGTSGTLVLNTATTVVSSSTLVIPQASVISFDGSTTGAQKIFRNTSGDLVLSTNRDILLSTTAGNVVIPSLTRVQFGSATQTMWGNTSGINVASNTNILIETSTGNVSLQTASGDIQLYSSSGNVRLLTNEYLVFGTSGTSNSLRTTSTGALQISGNTSAPVTITDTQTINLSASNLVNIPTNTRLVWGNGGWIFSDTVGNTTFINTTGSLTLVSPTTVVSAGTLTATSQFTNVVGNNVNVSAGNLMVRGGSTALYSDNVTLRDPVITLADTQQAVLDPRDRGVEYKYFDPATNSVKLGWFGWKSTTGNFTFYSDAVNTGEVITGTLGSLDIRNMTAYGQLQFATRGNIDVNCGTLANVNTITSCSGDLNIIANNSMRVSSGTVHLTVSTSVNLPVGKPVYFGSTGASIQSSTSGNSVLLNAPSQLDLNSGVLAVNCNTTNIYSTTVNVEDPIVSLGGVTGPVSNDGKDRGVEFKWGNGVSTKTGFFGYKNNLSRFVFIRDGINTAEVFSGALGDVQFGGGYFTGLDLQNGTLSNVNTVQGVQSIITNSSSTLQISAGSIALQSTSGIYFGGTSTSIVNGTAGLVISGTPQTTFSTGQVNLPGAINIGTTASIRTSSGNLVIANTSGNVELTPKASGGNVLLPINTYLSFGGTTNSIISDSQQLLINGYNGVGIQSSTFTISGNVNVIGSITTLSTSFNLDNYILPLGKDYKVAISTVTNDGIGFLRVTTSQQHYLTAGDRVTLLNTNSVPEVNGDYTVASVIDATTFRVPYSTPLTTPGMTAGTLKTTLMFDPGKDVGIAVNNWRSTAGSVTSGSSGYRTGFFGWKNTLNRWMFYENAQIVNDVVTGGTLGNVQINELFANRVSGFELTGTISAGSNVVRGTNFQIGGGAIDSTPIGVTGAQSGRFTSLSNTVSAAFSNVTFSTSVAYTFERYTLSSAGLQTRNPSINSVISLFSVSGVSYTGSSGTMPTLVTSVADGTFKMLVCASMGTGCEHTIYFGSGKLITPNPTNATAGSKLVFKRAGQSCQLVFDGVQGAWILLNAGAYVA